MREPQPFSVLCTHSSVSESSPAVTRVTGIMPTGLSITLYKIVPAASGESVVVVLGAFQLTEAYGVYVLTRVEQQV